MNDQEKSVMLAKAMGLEMAPHPIYGIDHQMFYVPVEWGYDWELADDFYHPSVMSLAWRVLNWAQQQECFDAGRHDLTGFTFNLTLIDSWIGRMIGQKNMGRLDSPSLFDLPPADAQRLWLDKILFLVIEAGLVEVRDENI